MKLIIKSSLIVLVLILSIVTITATEKKSTSDYESYSYCSFSDFKDDEKLNTSAVHDQLNKLYEEDLSIVVQAIYVYEDYKNLESIVSKINGIYEHVIDKKYDNVSQKEYLQAYKFGTAYIDYLKNEKKSISLTVNEEYQNEKLKPIDEKNKNDYRYFMDVMAKSNSDCSVNVDGLPVDKPYTISGYYPTYAKDGTGGKHVGIDIALPVGTPLYASTNATVDAVGTTCDATGGALGNMCGANGYQGGGNYVVLKTSDNMYFHYCHMAKVEVTKGQVVKQGERIGTSGHSGNSSGAHLHFEIHKNGSSFLDLGVESKTHVNPCDVVKGLCE